MNNCLQSAMNRRMVRIGILITALLLATCSSQPQLPPLPADATILAYGDSLTYGTGARRSESYPAVLSRMTGFEVVNAGVPGEVTSKGLKRLPGVLEEVQPQLVILCHGGNDILRKHDLKTTANNLRSMVRLAQQQGIPVLLIAVPQPGPFLSPSAIYEQVAEEMNVPIETEALHDILGERSLKSDTFHPNAKGYRIMAEAIYSQMKSVNLIR